MDDDVAALSDLALEEGQVVNGAGDGADEVTLGDVAGDDAESAGDAGRGWIIGGEFAAVGAFASGTVSSRFGSGSVVVAIGGPLTVSW